MRVYEVGKESNSADSAGLTMWDEFLPYVRLDVGLFKENNEGLDEPKLGEDVKPLSATLNILTEEQKKVYTIVTDEDETIIPLVIEKGSDKNLDEDGIIQVCTDKKVEGIEFEQESFETSVGKNILLKVTKTDPNLEDEVELRLVANDDSDSEISEGELEDVLCGRIRVKIIKKKPKYESLKIKVLDCRSNEIISSARVKKIVLNGAYGINTEFSNKTKFANDSNKIKNSQIALKGLGFNIETAGTTYESDSIEAYDVYWESRFPELVNQGVIKSYEEENPTDEMLDLIINEYNCNYSIDENGFLNLQIPKYLLNATTSLEIGLWDFPILLEATQNSETNTENQVLRESDTVGGGTDYQIRWGDGTEATPNDVTQDTEWNGNFGWHMKKDDRITEFKVSLQIPIKEGDDKFKEFDKKLMSPFYEDKDSPYHLVMYAMQWCQPVWDGIDDNPSGEVGAISDSSYIQHSDYHGMNMHIVSNMYDQGGSDYNGGKGYGKMEAELIINGSDKTGKYRSDSHKGFDLLANIGADLFAFRACETTYKTKVKNGVTHNSITLQWDSVFQGERNLVTYLHISPDNTNTNGSKEKVITGQIVAHAGRSGNLYWNDITNPGHVHLNVGSYSNNAPKRYASKFYDTHLNNVDHYNLKIFPNNNFPLALPCKGELGDSSLTRQATNGTGTSVVCNFAGNAVKQCWAAWELKCPLMKDLNNGTEANPNIRIIQAQLKFLNYYAGQGQSETHDLDGVSGNNLKTAIRCYKNNSTSVDIYDDEGNKATCSLVSNQSQYPILESDARANAFTNADDLDDSITQLLLDWLNQEAPLPTKS